MQLHLHPIDISIIIIYFIIVLAIGLWIGLKEKRLHTNDSDFFVAGRSLGWFAIGASLFASNISSEHLIGLAADGYRTGLAVGNYEWGATLVLIVLATVFVPFYIGSKIQTVPEFLENRFGLGARMYLSILTIIANVLVRLSVALYAGSLVMKQMFGIDMWTAIFVLALTTTIYTVVGGLRAVVYTDIIQTIILLIGTIALTAIALDKVGGWGTLHATLDNSMFDMVRSADDSEMPWPGLLLGVPVLGIWYWCTDQVIVQRVLGAKDTRNAQLGALFAAALKILPVFLFVLPGLCGRILFPEIDSKLVFPTLVTELLPVGITGLVAAALIAALMSSIDSTLNSTGTLISLDIFKRFSPNATTKKILSVGRISTLIVMIFGMMWVLVVARAESLFQYLQQVNAAISPPIAACFLVGIFWQRANHTGAITGLLGGLGIGLSLLIFEPFPFLISAGVTFFISIALIAVGSMFSPAPRPEQLQSTTWKNISNVLPENKATIKPIIIALLFVMISLWIYFS